jgi:hypothetical protein
MSKKRLFTEGNREKLDTVLDQITGEAPPAPDRLQPAKDKADQLARERSRGKAAAGRSRRVPKTSPTGREILPGRFEKVKVDGTPSRQGERERAEILKNARRATFYVDPEILRDIKALARKQGIGLSEAVNLAFQEYVKRGSGRRK